MPSSKPGLTNILEAPLMALGAAYNVEMTKPRTMAYLMAVDDLEPPRVLAAIRRAIREGGKYIPSPGELRQMAGAYARDYHRPWKDPYENLKLEPWPDVVERLKPKGNP